MSNYTHHISCKSCQKERFVLSIVIILIFFSCTNSIHASTDTTKTKKTQYDINDPRNPDCPCHKYQKLADEEYVRNTQSVDIKIDKAVQPLEKNINTDAKNKRTVIIKYSGSSHSKKNRLWMNKLKFRFINISRKLQKVKFSPNHYLCFKWN